MTDIKSFNISLSHPNINLDLNNSKDIANMQRTLSLLMDAKGNKEKGIDILRNTSFKYLQRLQADGIIVDKGGPDIVPVYDPFLTKTGKNFFKSGGYKKLFEVENLSPAEKKQFALTAENLHIGDNYGNYSQGASRGHKNKIVNTFQTAAGDQSAIVRFISKYWWGLLIPFLIGIILLLIEYNFFLN